MIPKFRVWQKSKKRWVEELGGDVYLTCDGQVLFGDLEYDFAKNVTDDVEIMQSTGLYDKNGVEIYEGDILEGYSVYPTGCDFYGHVKGEVYYSCRGTWDCYSFLLGDLNEQLEVIGNIHENPELDEVEE